MLDIDAFYLLLGERLRTTRNKKGMDQELLASRLDLTRASIINMEKGRQRPSVYQLWTLAQIFEVPITDFIPTIDLPQQRDEWAGKLENAMTDISNEEKKKLLEFITATRNNIK
jgi:transcriptional regulator with XRE-family HTH domain